MKKKFVKVLALGLALTMGLGLTACGNNDSGNAGNSGNSGNSENVGNGESGNGGVTAAPWKVLTTLPYGYLSRRVSPS